MVQPRAADVSICAVQGMSGICAFFSPMVMEWIVGMQAPAVFFLAKRVTQHQARQSILHKNMATYRYEYASVQTRILTPQDVLNSF